MFRFNRKKPKTKILKQKPIKNNAKTKRKKLFLFKSDKGNSIVILNKKRLFDKMNKYWIIPRTKE